MVNRKRIRTFNPAGGGGGGAPPTIGNVAWGPDFGEGAGNDGKTFGAGVATDLEALAINGGPVIGVQPKITSLVVPYDPAAGPKAGVQTALPAVAVPFESTLGPKLGVRTAMPTLLLPFESGTGPKAGVQTKLTSLVLPFDPAAGPKLGIHIGGTAVGAPFWQAVETNGATSAGSPATAACNVPVGTVDGDTLIAIVGGRQTAGIPGVTPPAGWTEFATRDENNNTIRGYWRIASSEPASYSWSVTGTANTTVAISITRINGAHATTPIDVSAVAGGSTNDPTAPTVTTTVANCMVMIACEQGPATGATYTPPAGWVERYDTNFGTAAVSLVDIAANDRVFAAIGATGAQLMDSTNLVAANWNAITVAIKPGTLVLAP